MMRFAILGNSGSGKSTLAGWLERAVGLVTLDLDTVAWEPGQPAVERDESAARADVAAFCARHEMWVVEGCYANLLEATFPYDPFLIFLNPGLDSCIANCRARPWEPHKYASKEAQDQNLDFLLDWVTDYYSREGPMSLQAHARCFAAYPGRKVELTRLPGLDPPDEEVLAWLGRRA